jgi:hypothetical protein
MKTTTFILLHAIGVAAGAGALRWFVFPTSLGERWPMRSRPEPLPATWSSSQCGLGCRSRAGDEVRLYCPALS